MIPARRNALVALVTVLIIGVLLLFPTSTNRTGPQRRPGVPLAPAGVQVTPAAGATGP